MKKQIGVLSVCIIMIFCICSALLWKEQRLPQVNATQLSDITEDKIDRIILKDITDEEETKIDIPFVIPAPDQFRDNGFIFSIPDGWPLGKISIVEDEESFQSEPNRITKIPYLNVVS